MAAAAARPRTASRTGQSAPLDLPTAAQIFTDCANCKQHILNSNLALHEAHCFRAFERCARCGAKVACGGIEAHRSDGTCDEAVPTEAASAAVSNPGGHVRRLQNLRQISNTYHTET